MYGYIFPLHPINLKRNYANICRIKCSKTKTLLSRYAIFIEMRSVLSWAEPLKSVKWLRWLRNFRATKLFENGFFAQEEGRCKREQTLTYNLIDNVNSDIWYLWEPSWEENANYCAVLYGNMKSCVQNAEFFPINYVDLGYILAFIPNNVQEMW